MNSFLQKNFLIGMLFVLTFCIKMNAQAPRKFSYQAVVRDATGNLVINRPVGIRFTILRGSATGIAVFAETHRPTTNNDGLASVEIGAGTALFNGIGNIDWALGPYYLKTEIDPNGATAYNIIGTNQLLSVPYALYAEKSANPGNPGWNTLIRTEIANPRTGTCRSGGITLYFGLDTNRNNVLDNAEINSNLTRSICNGKDGKGIVTTLDNGNGTFTFTYTDGTSFTTSNLTGQIGPQGVAGVGIVSTVDNGNGTFTLSYSNGTSFTTGNLTGPIGPSGPQGPQGPTGAIGPQGQAGTNGSNGTDGISIINSFVQGDSLYVSLSNGQTLNAGHVRGPQGLAGTSSNLPSGLNSETLRNVNGNWQANNFLINNGQQIAIGTSTPNSSALLELSSNSKGFLPPRMTTADRNAIINPSTGLVIFNTTQNCLNYFGLNSWYELCGNCTPPPPLAPASIVGSVAQCQNNTSQSYSVQSVQNAITYNWFVPTGWTIISGAGTNQILVNLASNAQSGSISVNATNGCGTSTQTSISVTVTTVPSAPFSASHSVSSSQIIWNWQAVSGASGYYVNTTNNLATAQFVNGTSFIQNGLICNTNYDLYVWATNSCGSSNSVQLTQATAGCCVIGTTNYGGIIAILNSSNPCSGLVATANTAPNTYSYSDAVNYCDNLVEGGFSDWYLPTFSQLTTMYNNRVSIGNFLNAVYWSPTPTGDGRFWTINFGNGQSYGYDSTPTYQYRVRCVRNF